MNNLFDEFNNINDHSTAKKPINDDCSPLSEEVELSCVDDKLKVVNRVYALSIFLAKVTLKNDQEKYL